MKFKIKSPLSVNILIGLIIGLIFGFIALYFNQENFVNNWVSPWGTIFLNMLKLVAVPIVFFSIICGIFGLGNIKDFSALAGKTFILYILTTAFAVTLGLLLVITIKPGKVFGDDNKIILEQQFSDNLTESKLSAEKVKESGPLSFLVDIVPENIFQATSDNTKMLQIIFISVMLGIVILLLPAEKTSSVRLLFTQISNIFIVLVDLIMKFAPFGVFALMAGMIVDFGGDHNILKALGLYAATVLSGLIFLTFIFYPLIVSFFTTIKLKQFFKAVYPAQVVAFTSSSSAITLPVTMRQVETRLDVPEKVSRFVLPLGMTINMDGTSLYQVVAVVFISQVFAIDLTLGQQMTIVLLALLSSIGAPGIPGGSIVMLVFILSSVGIPVEGLALILGIDRPLDMARTATNVTGDTLVCALISKFKFTKLKKG